MVAAPPADDFMQRVTSDPDADIGELPAHIFESVAQLTADLLDVSVAVISTITPDGLRPRAVVGLPADALLGPLPCDWLSEVGDLLHVTDLTRDRRFASLPIVAEDGLKMYAGVPLVTASGQRIGTLAVLGRQPAQLSDEHIRVLHRLAALVVSELEWWQRTRVLTRDLQRTSADLEHSRGQVSALVGLSEVIEQHRPEDIPYGVAQQLLTATRADWVGVLTRREGRLSVQAAHRDGLPNADFLALVHRLANAAQIGDGIDEPFWERQEPIFTDDYAASPSAVPELVAAGVRTVAVLPLGTYRESRYLLVAVRLDHSRGWLPQEQVLCRTAVRSVRIALDRGEKLRILDESARTDALTGLPNRRAFDDTVAGPPRPDEPWMLGLIDLDDFKRVNDTRGHAAGDRLLQLFARHLRSTFRSNDLIFRMGGDEFVLLIRQGTPLTQHDAEQRLAHVMRSLHQQGFPGIGASSGFAHWPADGQRIEEVLSCADQRMYQQKGRA